MLDELPVDGIFSLDLINARLKYLRRCPKHGRMLPKETLYSIFIGIVANRPDFLLQLFIQQKTQANQIDKPYPSGHKQIGDLAPQEGKQLRTLQVVLPASILMECLNTELLRPGTDVQQLPSAKRREPPPDAAQSEPVCAAA